MANTPRPERDMTPTGSIQLTTKLRTVEGNNSGVETLETIKNELQDNINHNDLQSIEAAGTGVTNGHIDNQAQTIDGVKTFSEFPKTPESNPTHNFQVATKKYVDDNNVMWDYTSVKTTGNCMALNSTTGCIKTSNVVYDKIGTNDFSIGFLVKRTGSNRGCIFAWGAAMGDDRNSIQIDIDELNDNFRFSVNHFIGGVKQDLSSFEIVSNDASGQIPNDGNWHKCAVVRKDRTFYMYVNGVSVPYTNKYSSDLDNVSLEALDYGWTIGQTEHGILQLEALVSNIQFTTGTLIDEDLQRVINAESITDFGKVISNYPLAEGNGGTVFESSGNGKSGHLTGNSASAWGNTQDHVFYNNDKGFSNRRIFDGSTNYVSFPDGGGTGTTHIIYAKVILANTGTAKKILNFRPSSGDGNEIRFEFKSTDKLSVTIIDSTGSGGNTYKQYTGDKEFDAGILYEVMSVWDGTNLKMYYNESGTGWVEDTPYAKSMDGSISMTDTTRIRRICANTTNGEKLAGIIHDLKVCEYSLDNFNNIQSGNEADAYSLRFLFNEASGTTIEDSSGNNDDGTFVGTTSTTKVPALLNGLTDAIGGTISNPSNAGGSIENGSETSITAVRANSAYRFKNILLGADSLEDWGSDFAVLRLGNNASIMSSKVDSTMAMLNNVYFDGSDYRFVEDGASTSVAMDKFGNIKFYVAETGTAGNVATALNVSTITKDNLEINGTGSGSNIKAIDSGTGIQVSANRTLNTLNAHYLTTLDSGGGDLPLCLRVAGNNQAVFNTNGDSCFTGKLGIENSSPFTSFHLGDTYSAVSGISPFAIMSTDANNLKSLHLENSSNESSASVRFVAKCGNADYLAFDQPSNANAGSLLDRVKRDSSYLFAYGRDLVLGTALSTEVVLSTNGNRAVVIDIDGNVGIGKDTPEGLFDITPDTINTTSYSYGCRVTTTQMNALTGMTDGAEVYNLTTHSKFYYNGNLSAWVEL
ncbi:MAG: hypothetical protein OMM_00958 [Candidatus Magnetoglobus multicellularis str. Araruama]|uniref:Laminin G domain-containing protein n=1 Tax=Candidatus Magnetoglobus multicellularis str. Araruama TaxID=890399 RepID=A0A1V1PF77_9BACT|nr:MAG: hypothetical protein OMM_00958 [Candidatus Magnetoglobus multicellularis str. Araruama]